MLNASCLNRAAIGSFRRAGDPDENDKNGIFVLCRNNLDVSTATYLPRQRSCLIYNTSQRHRKRAAYTPWKQKTIPYLHGQHGVLEGPRLGSRHGRHAFPQPLHHREGYLLCHHKGQPKEPVVPRREHRQVERDLPYETFRPALFSQHFPGWAKASQGTGVGKNPMNPLQGQRCKRNVELALKQLLGVTGRCDGRTNVAGDTSNVARGARLWWG